MTVLDLLTGPDAPALVRRILAARGVDGRGEVVRGRVHHRPGYDSTVLYTVGDQTVALTDAVVTGGVRLEHAGTVLTGWLHPEDPELPGLADALDPRTVANWLDGTGRRRPRIEAVELLSYRPLRRAVVRASAGEQRYFVKVLRADKVAAVAARQAAFSAAGVGPLLAARPRDGVLVLEGVRGRSLAERLAAWNAGADTLPDPGQILALLDRLPGRLVDLRPRGSWSERAAFHGAAAAAALPEQSEEIRVVAAHIARLVSAAPAAPVVPVHGDFYEANIFTDGERVTRVIDVDTAGPGRRSDDLACLLGHLAVLPDLSPAHYSRLADVTYSWADAFEQHEDAADLRARVAGVILSLVAGTTPGHATARLELCRSWLYRAEIARA